MRYIKLDFLNQQDLAFLFEVNILLLTYKKKFKYPN